MQNPDLILALAKLVGVEHVVQDEVGRSRYAHDRLPYANFRAREGALVGTLPSLVVRPQNTAEICAVVREASAGGRPIIPYGSGSGVLGGTIPLGDELILDMQRMNRILSIDRENNLVTVEAGMNGEAFEEELNEAGYTSGHLPQSLTISTVGGWAACRGGGQESSRFGKIENIVVGLKAVMPDGRILEVRPLPKRASGPSVLDIIVGSEGTLAIITELTLRIWRLPAAEEVLVFALPDRKVALGLAKRIMQAGLHPRIVRLYDEKETASRVEGIDAYKTLPVMANIVVCGEPTIVAAEASIVRKFAHEVGGVETEARPFEEWRAKRYVSITKQWLDRGYYNDTIEVTVNWSQVAALYDRIAERIASEVSAEAHFSAHWSHVYPEGVCQYMTLRLSPMEQSTALPMHEKMWEIATRETLNHGGSIAHHHGSGLFRGPWMDDEHGVGMDLLRSIKASVDPENLLNPGKLGFAPRADAIDPYRHRRNLTAS